MGTKVSLSEVTRLRNGPVALSVLFVCYSCGRQRRDEAK